MSVSSSGPLETETTKVGFRLPLLKSLHSEQYPVEHWIYEILTSDLVCITMASNFRDDHILDKITIMYTTTTTTIY